MSIDLLPESIRDKYEVHEWRHACAILHNDFPDEWKDMMDLLDQFLLCQSWITVGGRRRSKIAEAIDAFLHGRGWVEKEFLTFVMSKT
jgi:hypothetical protein